MNYLLCASSFEFHFFSVCSLKTQQGLLVDFAAFPQKFVDLLEMCIREEHKEMPK